MPQIPSIKKVSEHLTTIDPRLGEIILETKAPRRTTDRDPYHALIQSITSQQISVAAASTIYGRLLDLFTDRYPHAHEVIETPIENLRAVGLSQQKATYIHNAAHYSLAKGITYERLKSLDDEAVVKELTQIKGVGRWTVEMLLMFPLDRPDVFPLGDVGIQNAMIKLYRMRLTQGKPMHNRLLQISNRWAPYRSIACKYLWNWTDSDTQSLW